MTEIKSCPFCGGEFISIRMVRLNRRSGYRASCNGCGTTQGGIVHPSIEAAKEVWNRRAEPQQHVEPVAWMCPNDPDSASAFSWKPTKCNCGTERVPVGVIPQGAE